MLKRLLNGEVEILSAHQTVNELLLVIRLLLGDITGSNLLVFVDAV